MSKEILRMEMISGGVVKGVGINQRMGEYRMSFCMEYGVEDGDIRTQ